MFVWYYTAVELALSDTTEYLPCLALEGRMRCCKQIGIVAEDFVFAIFDHTYGDLALIVWRYGL